MLFFQKTQEGTLPGLLTFKKRQRLSLMNMNIKIFMNYCQVESNGILKGQCSRTNLGLFQEYKAGLFRK